MARLCCLAVLLCLAARAASAPQDVVSIPDGAVLDPEPQDVAEQPQPESKPTIVTSEQNFAVKPEEPDQQLNEMQPGDIDKPEGDLKTEEWRYGFYGRPYWGWGGNRGYGGYRGYGGWGGYGGWQGGNRGFGGYGGWGWGWRNPSYNSWW